MAAHAHKPTDELRQIVERARAIGLGSEKICKIVGLAKMTLEKHYAEELENGAASLELKIATKGIIEPALAGNVHAACMYLGRKCGWKETTVSEVTGADGGALRIEGGGEVDLARRVALLLERAGGSAVTLPVGGFSQDMSAALARARISMPPTVAPMAEVVGDAVLEDMPPRQGQVARFDGGLLVENVGPARAGLPDCHNVHDSAGRLLTRAGSWEHALAWCRKRMGEDKPSWKIETPPAVHEPGRRDQI